MTAPIITTEVENALLLMHFDPAGSWEEEAPARGPTPVRDERELNRREARRVLDVLYDVDRAFKHIELGLI